MFPTPAGEPIWGGTYFPDKPRYGRPGFPQILAEVARIYHDEPGRIENSTRHCTPISLQAPTAAATLSRRCRPYRDRLRCYPDPVEGGFIGAPKFPQPVMLEFFARAAARTGDMRYAGAVDLALSKMSEGGIYDHIGGGFARYSTDEVCPAFREDALRQCPAHRGPDPRLAANRQSPFRRTHRRDY
ncbi:MAG: DUF255 domain-containing protein [Hyphomicrobiales bacterium]